ncbi:hypothetical protein [Croceimicrobium hydrocarbonivorans]|uniref:Uncharacterized protein n=1 Tax=Croceimicrobium hydrocarbonivorans TaxID=2761580 RepID=A0A7H0VJN8_9FLAO|nr:hypothetical protein [Croceimicrobium hydrocarbonivorans]QNR25936.1 hypothetical protein H4K34_08850 [Croceimicrobium hydrocarbonivorans]
MKQLKTKALLRGAGLLVLVASLSILSSSCEDSLEPSTTQDINDHRFKEDPGGNSWHPPLVYLSMGCETDCNNGGICKEKREFGPMYPGDTHSMHYIECSCEGCGFLIIENGIAVPPADRDAYLQNLFRTYPLDSIDHLADYLSSKGISNYDIDEIRFFTGDTLDFYSYEYLYHLDDGTVDNLIVQYSKEEGTVIRAVCEQPCEAECLIRHGGAIGDFACSCAECKLKVTEYTKPENPQNPE